MIDRDEIRSLNEYPYSNIMGDTRNRSHKRVNRLTIFCAITLALYIWDLYTRVPRRLNDYREFLLQ